MPASTNQSIAPFYNTFNKTQSYYQVMFQPGVSVQTRELNELQSILKNQIEQFGDNIFKSGTIISGCNLSAINPFPYAKLADVDVNGNAFNVWQLVGYNAINETTGKVGVILNFADGFETTPPDMKTIYVNYKNMGTNGTVTNWNPGDVLKVYDSVVNGIEQINIVNGGVGFSNTDQIVAVSQLVVTVTSGTATVGDYLLNGQGANVQIVAVDANTYSNTSQVLIQVAPRPVDLANGSVSSAAWSVIGSQTVKNPANTFAATVNSVIGSGLMGSVTTDSSGTLTAVNIFNKGQSYTSLPYVTVRSINNSTGYSTLNLTPQNYFKKVTISNSSNATGNAYAYVCTEGVIYQKGYFLYTVPQLVFPSKYDQNPNNVVIGFITTETIVDSNIDPALLDNANGTQNIQAPGAARLKLVPQLVVVNTSYLQTNSEFLPLITFKDGLPYKQSTTTQYNVIEDHMAQRMEDTSGDFVVDPFLVTTRSPTDSNLAGNTYNIVIDPGKAYVSGYLVQSFTNYSQNVPVCTDTALLNTHIVSLNYGNFIYVNNMAGFFQFNTGTTIDLYDTAAQFLTNSAGTIASVGTKIGTANVRSLVRDSNEPGTVKGVYRVYLFNIQMNAGKNFKDVKSIYYNGTYKGIADVVTSTDPGTGAQIAQLQNTDKSTLLFYAGADSPLNVNNAIYTYRTIDSTLSFANTGLLTKDISGLTGTQYPYSQGSLSLGQMLDLYVVPLASDMRANNASSGTVSCNATTTVLTGSGTAFLTDYQAGDWIYVTANSTGGHDTRQVVAVTNNTSLQLNANCSFANATATTYRVFPAGVPIPLGVRTGLSANIDSSSKVLTVNLGNTFSFSGSTAAAVGCNIERIAPTQISKTANRNNFVKFNTTSNPGGTAGPWCMGVPGIFRLRGVYVGNSSVSNTGTNYVSSFYVDHNQNPDFRNLGWLYLKPYASVPLTSNTYILAQFDYFTDSAVGYADVVSYIGANSVAIQNNNSQNLATITSAGTLNTFEIPEVFDDQGNEYDLIQYLDFRPRAANTVAPTTLPSTAPLDPGSTLSFNTQEMMFPLPDSQFICDIEYFLRRTDSVFVDKNTNFIVAQGVSTTAEYLPPAAPAYSIKLADIEIPSYPAIPINYNSNILEILNNGVANQKYLTTRVNVKTIAGPTSNTVLPYNQPRVYTNYDIGNIDRRLKDVEYIINLNALEANLANKNIPSSVDPTLNRFQFGLFVDDFTSAQYSAIHDPQYAAIKEADCIVPQKMLWDINFVGLGDPPWLDFPIIDQSTATVGGITDPLSLGPTCALNMANTVAYTQLFRNATDTGAFNGAVDVVQVTMANQATVMETVNYANETIDQYLAQHPDQAYLFNNALTNAAAAAQAGQSHFGMSQGKAYTGTSFGDWGGTSPPALLNSEGLGFLASAFQKLGYGNYAATLTFGPDGQLIANNVGPGGDSISNLFPNLTPNVINSTPPLPSGTFATSYYNPPVTLYFYCYDQPVKIEVFQGSNLIIDTSSASSLTQNEITFLTGVGGQQWFNDFPNYFIKPLPNTFVNNGSGYVSYAGKITFNYDPTQGNLFTVRTTESTNSNRWRWVMAYPIDGSSVGCANALQKFDVFPTFESMYRYTTDYAACGNGAWGGHFTAQYLGYTTIWNPVPIPVPTTSSVPFDLSADWVT